MRHAASAHTPPALRQRGVSLNLTRNPCMRTRSALFVHAPLALLLGLSALTAQAADLPDATLQAAAKEAGAVVTASGLVYRSLKDGSGTRPKASDTVQVHYRGRFPDGREFDSSYQRYQPAEFPLSRVIPCWTEGVQRMQVGGSAKLTCPASIAYGKRGAGGVIPPNATLVFEVELLAVRQ
jgi:FKBP-type peptidyl-prolyl cis-trans isomerase FkpA